MGRSTSGQSGPLLHPSTLLVGAITLHERSSRVQLEKPAMCPRLIDVRGPVIYMNDIPACRFVTPSPRKYGRVLAGRRMQMDFAGCSTATGSTFDEQRSSEWFRLDRSLSTS